MRDPRVIMDRALGLKARPLVDPHGEAAQRLSSVLQRPGDVPCHRLKACTKALGVA
jgi:hypothetical protein